MFYQEKENWSHSCFSINVDLNRRKLSAVLELLLENMARIWDMVIPLYKHTLLCV